MKSLLISQSKDVLDMWLQRTLVLVKAHSYSANYYKVLHYSFGIAIILISGIMTFPILQEYSQYFSSIIVIMASIYVFLNFNDYAARHRFASKSYGEILRLLETQKGFDQSDSEVLQRIQQKIDRINTEAPEVPTRLFKKANNEIKLYLKNIEQDSKSPLPSLVKNVRFETNPSFTHKDLTQEHFNIELEYFSRYAACPTTFSEFVNKYSNKSFISSEAYINGNLIGFSLFEKIDDSFYHFRISAVQESYRKLGIGKQMAINAKKLLTKQQIKYFTLFTAEEVMINNLLRGVADPVGLETSLNKDEILYLQKLEKYRKLKVNSYGTQRSIENYYHLRDGNNLSAIYKLYKI